MSANFYELLKYAQTGIASPSMTYYDKMRANTLMGGVVQTLTGIPPLSFKADGTPLISWSMKGNGSQTGTPTPDNPIIPDFVGVRTAQLFDESLLANNKQLDNTTGLPVSYSGRIASTDPVDVSQYSTVTISYVTTTTIKAIYSIFSNGELVGRFTAVSSGLAIDVSNADKMYICFYSTWGGNIDTSSVSDIMLNSGSTALPYEPFGWAEKITCAGQTVPVYLGQVSTVRRVKKLVLTGEENITSTHTDIGLFNIPVTDYLKTASTITNICSHYRAETNVNGWSDVTDLTCRFYGNAVSPSKLLYIRDSSFSTVDDFKSYLAQQYAAGTPVCVWYVLATEQTGIVNEPLAKIGDYADELSSEDAAVTIPTVKGQNTLTVDTPIQPSEMTITFKG